MHGLIERNRFLQYNQADEACKLPKTPIERNRFLQYNQAKKIDEFLKKQIERNRFLQYNQALCKKVNLRSR